MRTIIFNLVFILVVIVLMNVSISSWAQQATQDTRQSARELPYQTPGQSSANETPGPGGEMQPGASPNVLNDLCFESLVSGEVDTADCADVIAQLRDYSGDFEVNRRLAAAYSNRALGRGRADDNVGALADLQAAIDLQPLWAELYLNRGNLQLRQADYTAALTDYDQALMLSEGRLRAVYFNRAFVQRALGQPRQAEMAVQQWQGTSVALASDAESAFQVEVETVVGTVDEATGSEDR